MNVFYVKNLADSCTERIQLTMKGKHKKKSEICKFIYSIFSLSCHLLPFSTHVNPFYHGFSSLILIFLFPFPISHSGSVSSSFTFWSTIYFTLFSYSVISLSMTAIPTPSVLLAFHSYLSSEIFCPFCSILIGKKTPEWPQVLLFTRSIKNIDHMHNSKQVYFSELCLPTLWNIFAQTSSFSKQVAPQFSLRIDQQRVPWTYF